MLNSSRMSIYLRRAAKRFLTHTYTWVDNDTVPVLDEEDNPTYNEWDQPIVEDATPVTDKRCLFLFEDVVSDQGNGPVTTKVPTLYVLHDDPVSVDDVVTNVQSRDGTVLLESARVESIDSTAEAGDAVMKVLRLSGAVTV